MGCVRPCRMHETDRECVQPGPLARHATLPPRPRKAEGFDAAAWRRGARKAKLVQALSPAAPREARNRSSSLVRCALGHPRGRGDVQPVPTRRVLIRPEAIQRGAGRQTVSIPIRERVFAVAKEACNVAEDTQRRWKDCRHGRSIFSSPFPRWCNPPTRFPPVEQGGG